jgi:transglutaminase-like putative cysteine protease
MKILYAACAVGVWLAGASTGLLAQERTCYTLAMNGQPIGTAEFASEDVSWDGRPVRRLRSVTTIKFAVMGSPRTIVRRATTLIDPASHYPIRFELDQTVNDALTHIESHFEEGEVRTWQWAEGSAKGEPQVTPHDQRVLILANNDFAHWNLLARVLAAEDAQPEVTVRAFVPDAPQVQAIRFVRGDLRSPDGQTGTGTWRVWRLEGAGIEIAVDVPASRLAEMTVPAQNTIVKLADEREVRASQEAGAPEILSQHFTQSDVRFDDFLKVQMLTARIQADLIGAGPSNPIDVLTTPMQQFEGRKEGASVSGTFTVHTRRYVPNATIGFPAQNDDSVLSEWLRPEPMIESDDTAIAELAREVTAAARTRWEAVTAVAQWVHREIRYAIADSPSAKMALERRRGDCGPHATLTVAMLRSVGIPARLVGGLVYTPSLGGSFGQHGWVEVAMGDDGWIALDPTTGELESLSATHIKLFEGMGGVIPREVEVIDYVPKNRELATPARSQARPLTWKLDRDYVYSYSQNGTHLGTETFRLRQSIQDEQPVWELTDKFDLTAGGTRVQSSTRMLTSVRATPLLFDREMTAQGSTVKRICQFRDQAVSVRISGAVQATQDLQIPGDCYCFDNNLIASFALICSQFELEENTQFDIRTFHPTSSSVINLTFQVKGVRQIRLGNAEQECFECWVEPIKNTFWITRDGRLVKVEAGGLSIEVSPIE